MAVVAYHHKEVGALEGQVDLDVRLRAAVAHGVRTGLLDCKHNVVDLLRVKGRELQMGAQGASHAEHLRGLGQEAEVKIGVLCVNRIMLGSR